MTNIHNNFPLYVGKSRRLGWRYTRSSADAEESRNEPQPQKIAYFLRFKQVMLPRPHPWCGYSPIVCDRPTFSKLKLHIANQCRNLKTLALAILEIFREHKI